MHGHGFSRMQEDKADKKTDYKKLSLKMAPLLWPDSFNLRVRALQGERARALLLTGTKKEGGSLAESDAPSFSFQPQVRVVACVVTLVGARVANVMVPILYKDMVDEMAGIDGPVAFPLKLIIWYSVLKLLQSLQRDLRNFLWIEVEQDTSRRIKIMVFRWALCECTQVPLATMIVNRRAPSSHLPRNRCTSGMTGCLLPGSAAHAALFN